MDQELNPESPSLDLQKLKTISVLGRGAKGIAFLIRNEKQTLALKVISKSTIEKKKNEKKEGEEEIDHYKRIWFERDVLNCFDHPLLPRLRGVLNTDDVIGFAIDYCSGGDLNSLRKQQTERMFSNDAIRFYAVELVLVLEYLHSLGIIYRDLKPENILIQENGHLMIVDFDLSTKLSSPWRSIPLKQQKSTPSNLPTAKRRKKKRISGFLLCKCTSDSSQVDSVGSTVVETQTQTQKESVEKSRSFVGTEDYVAPEIIIGNGHDFSVDWWSLGVVLYEMLYGKTPFRGANRKETFYRILTKSPELVGEQTELRDLIGKLLVKEPANRISVEEIKGHSYFKGVDWESILEISRPPYIPPMKWDDETDLEEIDGIDLKLVVDGLLGGDEIRNIVEKEKINGDIEKNNKNVWVDGLKSSYTDDDFLNIF